ncbi:hypothetical protein HPB52_016107 [Rhipicephalus sanguineus]|uniref:THAP-type domain-containing protein n=1 Tax=Rhipicephalus sanguineus TaxID=34632 RepID=A0A9D4PY00_RHISA|nr:hypothetical protein HPB52_016107 [Rhipicephalus sanguineus]
MAPIFCPVKSCSSETGDNGCKFHRFPSDPALRETWVAFVRRGRGGDWTPTKRSLLCSCHFTPDAYTCSIQLMADFGLSTKNVRLKSDAVPTLCHPAVTARHDAFQGRGKRDCRGNNLKRVGDPEVRAPAEVSATTCRNAERHDTEASIKKRLRRDPEDSCRPYSEQTHASDHSSSVPTFASPSKECQTELTTADLALLEDMLHPRCSTPLPIDDSCDESYGFVDNSQDCVKKQLIAAGKHRGCELIGLWRRSIIAHLYFAVGVGKGNGDLAIAVWLSLLNHIQDKHTGHGLLYPECKHGELERRKWILPAYVNHLLSAVEELLACGSKGGTDATPQPPHLSAAFGPVDKVAIVEAHKSRFAGN